MKFSTYKVENCGNVKFHYPFSMEDKDDSNDWFKVNCTKTANGQKAPTFTTQILKTTSGLQVVGINSFFANMSNIVDSSDYKRKRSCGFVSLASYDSFFTDDFDLSNRTHVSMQLQRGTLIYGECYLNDSSDTSCILEGDYCWSMLSSTHLCVCSKDTSDISYSRSCK
ncbi:hypothetical protein Gogos_012625, partial [Gossypium gossypioides]|nr:hypothetical protein [Gossypium gossypioides]